MENNAAWKFAHHDVDLTGKILVQHHCLGIDISFVEADRSKYAGRGRSRDRKAVAGSGLVNKLLSIGLGRANGATNSVPPSRQGDEDIVDGYASSQRLPRVATENGRGGAKRAGPAEERHWAQDPAVLVLPEPDVRTKDSTFDEIEKQAKVCLSARAYSTAVLILHPVGALSGHTLHRAAREGRESNRALGRGLVHASPA